MKNTPEWPDIKIVPRFCGESYISIRKSDTPETDALHEMRKIEFRDILSQYFEMVDHARKLERERDELRRVVEELREQLNEKP